MAEECAECGASFSSTQELIQHAHDHSAQATGEGFTSMNVPTEVPHAFMCMLCGARFVSPQALALHNLEPHKDGPTADRRPSAARRRDLRGSRP
jgi:DNA-directed RNA polymerase subunit RPC12/RpoP